MNTQLLTRSVTAALMAAAITAPAASAEPFPQRFGSPDAIDRNMEARTAAAAEPLPQGFGSPDAIDRNTETPPVDMRGADAKGVRTDAPGIRVVRINQPAPTPSSADDAVDWLDALLGAGGALGLTLLGLGATLAIVHRRSPQIPA